MVKNIVGEYNEWSEQVDVLTLVHVDIVGEVMVAQIFRSNLSAPFFLPQTTHSEGESPWALLGLAPAASCPGVNSSFTEE